MPRTRLECRGRDLRQRYAGDISRKSPSFSVLVLFLSVLSRVSVHGTKKLEVMRFARSV